MPGLTALKVENGGYTPFCHTCKWTGTATLNEDAASLEADGHEASVHGVDHEAMYDPTDGD